MKRRPLGRVAVPHRGWGRRRSFRRRRDGRRADWGGGCADATPAIAEASEGGSGLEDRRPPDAGGPPFVLRRRGRRQGGG